jgi:hypothetical protein
MTLNREDQNQTVDSIIIFQSGEVHSTGQPIFTITTKYEKRKTDSTNEAKKKEIPNPFAPVRTYSNFSLSEKSLFSITMYDTLGNEKVKLVNNVLPPGEYEVNYSIYYIVEPNVYLLETKYKGFNDYRKLIINQNNPDSIIYIVDKWGLTTITTLSTQQKEEQANPLPFAPSTPFTVEVRNICVINMRILDTNNVILEKYEFSALTLGSYCIKWWAFYKNLPPGIYKFKLQWLDKYEEHKIIKLE